MNDKWYMTNMITSLKYNVKIMSDQIISLNKTTNRLQRQVNILNGGGSW